MEDKEYDFYTYIRYEVNGVDLDKQLDPCGYFFLFLQSLQVYTLMSTVETMYQQVCYTF